MGETNDISADNWTMYFLLLKQTFIWNKRVMLSGWDSQSKRTNINLRSFLRDVKINTVGYVDDPCLFKK